jgi:predicted Ser/Thr protein kinase
VQLICVKLLLLLLQVLQHEIRKTHAKSQQHEWIEELTLTEIVGKGGFGVVYKGTWKGSVAAVKVGLLYLASQ